MTSTEAEYKKVSCPTCGTPPGQSCESKNGTRIQMVHVARKERYYTAFPTAYITRFVQGTL